MIPKTPAINEGENLVTSALKNLAIPVTDNWEASRGTNSVAAVVVVIFTAGYIKRAKTS